MKQQQKLARLTTVNQLLEQLNTSVPIEKVEIRKLIAKPMQLSTNQIQLLSVINKYPTQSMN